MRDEIKSADKRKTISLTTDFLGENRREFVAKLAYHLWEERGRPFGSPEVDWWAAEQAVCAALTAAGLVPTSAIDSRRMDEMIYA